MKRALLVLASALLIGSCNSKPKQESELIRPSHETIINYSGNSEDRETIEYIYGKPTDRFWIKAIHKDNTGKQFLVTKRQLDPKTRMPIKEFAVDELGETDYIYKVEYAPGTCLLLKKVEYKKTIAPENKSAENLYTYKDGVLVSSTTISYSTDANYKNADGTKVIDEMTVRYLPLSAQRGQGTVEAFYRVEKHIKYATQELIEQWELKNIKPGDIFYTEKTKFNPSGIPIEYESTDPSAGADHRFSKEFYVVKMDGKGRIAELIPYSNEKRDSLGKDALMWKFSYDNSGKIKQINEFMLNEKNNQFDLTHGREDYTWYAVAPNQLELSTAGVISEHFCQHRKVYSKNATIIEKFTKAEKITITKVASMDGGFPTQELPGTVTRKSIVKFETVKK